jgi:hypothetical protein
MNLIGPSAPVAFYCLEKIVLAIPQMGTAGNITEQKLGFFAFFQTNERREALKFDRELTEGRAVGGGISGKEFGSRQEGFRLGQWLTDA